MAKLDSGKLSKFRPLQANPNKHTQRGLGLLQQSMQEDGWVAPITVAADGESLDGAARMEVAADKFGDDVIVVEHDGTKPIVCVRVDIANAEMPIAKRIAYRANRVAQVDLAWDAAQIAADMESGLDLTTMFYDNELAAILEDAANGMLAGLDGDMLGVPKDAKPNPRELPIDVIYTLQMADCTCCLAVQAGLKYGIQSAHYRLCPYTDELGERHKVAFIDNDYFKYDHAVHLRAVQELRPKYATVRDIMSKMQCQEEDIAFYEFEQIMDWAEELAQYAEHVIVIPKYDCLDAVPDKFMLGYSVPSSHGGTPLPVAMFKGKRVHLLGGSWKAQLAHMSELGDDVASVDNNQIQNIARQWGQFITPEGETQQLQDAGYGYLTNVRYAALALSFGAIGAKINELYPKGSPAEAGLVS